MGSQKFSENPVSGSEKEQAVIPFKIRPPQPLSLLSRLRYWSWLGWVGIHNFALVLYIAWILMVNKVWSIGRNPERKKFRKRDPNKPLKVGVVNEYYFPHIGGTSFDVHHAAIEFTKLGYDTKLITPNVDDPKYNIQHSPHGFEILRVGKAVPIIANGSFAKICMGWRLGRDVKRLIDEQQFDVIHIHCPISPVLPMLFQVYADCPIIGHLHTLLKSKSLFYRLFRKPCSRFMQDFEGLVAVSDVAAKPFEKFFNCKFKVIPNGIPVDDFIVPLKPIEKFDDGKINLFFIGRMEPRNGITVLLEAFRIIHKEEPNTRLILAGDGPWRPFFDDSVEPELKPHVHFVGMVRDDKPRYFATGHINICPTAASTASLGLTLLESMASGRPTVASDIPAFNETIDAGHDVLVAGADSPEDFARQVLRLIRDPELGKEMAKRAQEKMIARYSWTSIIGRVDEYTNEILNKIHSTNSAKTKSSATASKGSMVVKSDTPQAADHSIANS